MASYISVYYINDYMYIYILTVYTYKVMKSIHYAILRRLLYSLLEKINILYKLITTARQSTMKAILLIYGQPCVTEAQEQFIESPPRLYISFA